MNAWSSASVMGSWRSEGAWFTFTSESTHASVAASAPPSFVRAAGKSDSRSMPAFSRKNRST